MPHYCSSLSACMLHPPVPLPPEWSLENSALLQWLLLSHGAQFTCDLSPACPSPRSPTELCFFLPHILPSPGIPVPQTSCLSLKAEPRGPTSREQPPKSHVSYQPLPGPQHAQPGLDGVPEGRIGSWLSPHPCCPRRGWHAH